MSAENFLIPVSNGIFGHREKIGAAIWTFLWLIDKTTGEVAEDGAIEGLVLGGAPIPVRRIAADLSMEVRSVYDHIDALVAGRYIRRIEYGVGRATGFVVMKSKRQRKTLKGIGESITTHEVLPQGTPEEIRTDPTVKVHKPLKFSATHNRKEDITRQYKETNTPPDGLCTTGEQAFDRSLTLTSPLGKPAKNLKSAKMTATVPDSVVDGMYRTYPRHVAPGTARKAIAKAIARVAVAQSIPQEAAAEWLQKKVECYAAQVKRAGTEIQFVPYPATWFNSERYDDDSYADKSRNSGGTGYADPAALYSGPEYQASRRLA